MLLKVDLARWNAAILAVLSSMTASTVVSKVIREVVGKACILSNNQSQAACNYLNQ